jgi:hypothetical protein
MGERVSSETPSISTYRASLAPSGATSRPRIELPADSRSALPDSPVRLVLDGTTYHAPLRLTESGPVIQGAYGNARLARSSGEGTNHLPAWVELMDLAIGRSVMVDVVVPETLLGARPPGTTVVYEPVDPPDSSLRSIAEGLEE